MKIYILGKNGYIASNITKYLKGKFSVSNITYNEQTSSNFNIININDIEKLNDKIHEKDLLIDCSWFNPSDFENSFHLSISLPKKIFEYEKLLSLGFKRIIHFGTCLEYGLFSGEINENIDPLPVIPYGIAKNSLRQFLDKFACQKKINLIWCRIFYLYGENRNKKNLFSDIQKSLLEKTKLKTGSLDKVRDFIHMKNFLKILDKLIYYEKNLTINICSNEPISILNFIKKISGNKINENDIEYCEKYDYWFEPNNFYGYSNFLNQ